MKKKNTSILIASTVYEKKFRDIIYLFLSGLKASQVVSLIKQSKGDGIAIPLILYNLKSDIFNIYMQEDTPVALQHALPPVVTLVNFLFISPLLLIHKALLKPETEV